MPALEGHHVINLIISSYVLNAGKYFYTCAEALSDISMKRFSLLERGWLPYNLKKILVIWYQDQLFSLFRYLAGMNNEESAYNRHCNRKF